MTLENIGGRLAQLLMVVRMVEEQSDLTAFLVPVELSLPAMTATTGTTTAGSSLGSSKDARNGTNCPAARVAGAGDVSSSESEGEEDDEIDGDEGDDGASMGGNGRQRGWGLGGGKGKPGRSGVGGKKREEGEGQGKGRLAIEKLRYHKKVCMCVLCLWGGGGGCRYLDWQLGRSTGSRSHDQNSDLVMTQVPELSAPCRPRMTWTTAASTREYHCIIRMYTVRKT